MKKTLRIGIDGSFLGEQPRGYSRYIIELLKSLDSFLPDAQFFVYSPNNIKLPIQSKRWHLRSGGKILNFTPITWLKLVGSYLCRQDQLDIFWGGYFFLPYLPKSVSKILTVYDFVFLVNPKEMHNIHKLAFHLFLRRDILRSDQVISISQGTAKRTFEFSGRSSVVITPSVKEHFQPQSNAAVQECCDYFGIDTPYFLNIATWEPRKNIDVLVKSFIKMKEKGLLPKYSLVLVGKKGWGYQQLEEIVTKHNSIYWLGYVPDEYLSALYTGADLFIFPSLYEGFGMPVLESRVCGTRVVTTNCPELCEAGGSDTIYIEPTEESLEQGILKGLADKTSLNFPKYPTWEEQGKKLVEIIKGFA